MTLISKYHSLDNLNLMVSIDFVGFSYVVLPICFHQSMQYEKISKCFYKDNGTKK